MSDRRFPLFPVAIFASSIGLLKSLRFGAWLLNKESKTLVSILMIAYIAIQLEGIAIPLLGSLVLMEDGDKFADR